jgi:hypothetical protein
MLLSDLGLNHIYDGTMELTPEKTHGPCMTSSSFS